MHTNGHKIGDCVIVREQRKPMDKQPALKIVSAKRCKNMQRS